MNKKSGRVLSEETRNKMSNSRKGKKLSEEAKKKLSLARLGDKNPNWKGKSTTELSKKKLSLALTGMKRSELTKRRLSDSKLGEKNPNYGREFTDEERKALSLRTSGDKNPNWKGRKIIYCEICKNEMSLPINSKRKTCSKKCRYTLHAMCMTGHLAPNWKGGISTEPYCYEWGNKEYKEFIKERDNFQCQNPNCNKKSSRLAIHHINYDKSNCHYDNLITLCFSCNSKANYNRDYWESLYKTGINNANY